MESVKGVPFSPSPDCALSTARRFEEKRQKAAQLQRMESKPSIVKADSTTTRKPRKKITKAKIVAGVVACASLAAGAAAM